MKDFKIEDHQITIWKLIYYHLYLGIPMTIAYVFLSKHIVNSYEAPVIVALLIVELLILTPGVLFHLYRRGFKLNGKYSLKNIVFFTQSLTLKKYVQWSFIGFLGCMLCYIPLYPVGLFIKENLFFWLPEWYFNFSFGTNDSHLIAKAFLFGILIDGLVGPIAEELFFRGYLLPRMAYLKNWAPLLNGSLFGLYHFWQPHNLLAISLIGILISYIVWKNKNVYLGIIIHCSLNLAGAISGYLAVTGGYIIPR